MDFIAEEELCQQAYEVWLHYACPTCAGLAPQPRLKVPVQLSSDCDGPCSVLPLVFFPAFPFESSRSDAIGPLPRQ